VFKNFGAFEILLILGIVLLLFGATRLPQIGHSLGRSFREFKGGITGTAGSANGDKPAKAQPGADEAKGTRH